MSTLSGLLSEDWEVKVEGTYGEFNTPAGQIAYLLTKAKLGLDTTKESRLTKYLAPVREVLSVDKMDFNQLLQRDLDDYRVATSLLDYLLKEQHGGPAFYTPILAALLPFEGVKPVDYYPSIVEGKGFKDTDGICWQQEKYGRAFRILKFATDETGEQLQPIKLGRLEFNEALNKLVVIDGQHRAMALLAIRRTIANEWDNSKGAKYKSFYEKRVNELLPGSDLGILNSIEFPVCICWFPGMTIDSHPQRNPHAAARKLFVDVNKNARTPSKSRLILLSDNELIPILIRSLLNKIRLQDSPLPLHVIEYDYPKSKGESYPVRPLALVNIVIIENSLDMALRGAKYVKEVTLKVRGRSSQKDSDAYLRDELEIKNWLPQEIEEEELEGKYNFDTLNMGNENFPRSKVEDISNVFLESWGQTFLDILANFYPFRCHVDAVNSLEANWNAAATSQADLAKDAMFKGLGIYWTLKEEYTKWTEENTYRRELGQNLLEKTETCKAWEIVLQKEAEFSRDRAKRLFARKLDLDPTKDLEWIEASENTFSTLKTQAFVTGSVLALASLKYELKYSLEEFKGRSKEWIELWNEYLSKNQKRLNIFNRRYPNAFLKFSKLDSPYSVYFRYLIFEMMYAAGKEKLENSTEMEVIRELLYKTRSLYLDELATQQVKALRKTNPELTKKEVDVRAISASKILLGSLCKEWFAVTKSEFSDWLETLKDGDRKIELDELESSLETDLPSSDEIGEESDDELMLSELIDFED